MFKKFAVGKYRSIVASVALFVLLDASVLILNFYISFDISTNAAAVNLAGRQRMLSQRMVKELYGATGQNSESMVALQELENTVFLFDSTLNAFDKGAKIKGTGDDFIEVEPITSPVARTALERAQVVWKPYREQLAAVILASNSGNLQGQQQAVTTALQYAKANNITLLNFMNNMTTDLQRVASLKATTLRIIQSFGIMLAVANFFIILFHFIGQLRESDGYLEAARRQNREILETVQEGLFLINRDYIIGDQHSDELLNIFSVKEVANSNFIDLLSRLVTPKDLSTAQKFLEVLFNPRVVEKLIDSLNPLEQIEFNIVNQDGGYDTKYLRFSFARVVEEKVIVHILVTVTEVTREVQLQQQLDNSKNDGDRQLELLTAFLHCSPAVLQRFVLNTRKALNRANDVLKSPVDEQKGGSRKHLRTKAQTLYQEIHRIKGDASSLEFGSFVDMAHEFETELQEISDNSRLRGNDFLPLTIRLEQLMTYTDTVEKLSESLSGYINMDSPAVQHEKHWSHLQNLASNIGRQQNKSVDVLVSGLAEHSLDENTSSLVNDVCVQLVRNAVVHGIETREERQEKRKPMRGRIDIVLNRLPDERLELSIRDDGRGIDLDKIRKEIVNRGLASSEQAINIPRQKLINYIFRPEFSTSEVVDQHAGRGVGMSLVKQMLTEANGRMRIDTRKGRFSQFRIVLPPSEQQQLIKEAV